MKSLFKSLVFLISLISIIIPICVKLNVLIVLPIVFFIMFILLLNPLMNKNNSITLYIFTITSMMRYCLLPMFETLYPITHLVNINHFNSIEFVKGLFLMVLELVAISFFFYLFFRLNTKNKINKKENFIVLEKNIILSVLIVLSLILIINSPNITQNLNFFIIGDSGERLSSKINQFTLIEKILMELFNASKIFLFVIGISFLYKKYNTSKNKKLIYLVTLIFSIIIIGVIVTEERSIYIYFGFPILFILYKLFPAYRKHTIIGIFSILIIAVGYMTLYKTIYLFKFDSISTAIGESNFNFNDLTYQLEIYLLGPYSYCVGNQIVFSNNSLIQLLYDISRPFIGLNFLVKDLSINTSTQLYCLLLTSGTSDTGYLLPISVQGGLYFGKIFGSLLLWIPIYISLKFERKIHTENRIFLVFVYCYLFIRFATCNVFSDINTIITHFSMSIYFLFIPYYFQRCINLGIVNKFKG